MASERRQRLEQPKQSSFGELAIPVAFHLARQLKQAPRAIAAELVAGLGSDRRRLRARSGRQRIHQRAAGSRRLWLRACCTAWIEARREHVPGKIIVEHTNINPNKAAHIGHLRNAMLGDTFVRMLRANGRNVEVQNYIDNTGVQVADVVAGFHFLRKDVLRRRGRADADARDSITTAGICMPRSPRTPELEGMAPARRCTPSSIARANDRCTWRPLVSDAIVGYHLDTMRRLDIDYDVLPRESEILHLKFWETAFEQLKERKAIYFETEGKNKGCWVMPASAFKEQTGEDTDDSKVIVRSNNTVTYVGKDIAYQLWKFGLLGKDFYYECRGPDERRVHHDRRAAAAADHRIRPRRFGVQRDRFAPVVLAGRGRRRAARARL